MDEYWTQNESLSFSHTHTWDFLVSEVISFTLFVEPLLWFESRTVAHSCTHARAHAHGIFVVSEFRKGFYLFCLLVLRLGLWIGNDRAPWEPFNGTDMYCLVLQVPTLKSTKPIIFYNFLTDGWKENPKYIAIFKINKNNKKWPEIEWRFNLFDFGLGCLFYFSWFFYHICLSV